MRTQAHALTHARNNHTRARARTYMCKHGHTNTHEHTDGRTNTLKRAKTVGLV